MGSFTKLLREFSRLLHNAENSGRWREGRWVSSRRDTPRYFFQTNDPSIRLTARSVSLS